VIACAAVRAATTVRTCGAAGAADAGADTATVVPSAAASVAEARPIFITRVFMLILPEAGSRADQSVNRRYKAPTSRIWRDQPDHDRPLAALGIK
jgi:hypothetical protein